MKKGKKKRAGSRARSATSHGHKRTTRRRRFSRNPRGFSIGGVVGLGMRAGVNAGGVIAGKVAARTVRGLVGQQPGSIFGSAVEIAVGLIGGTLLGQVSPRAGEMFATGAITSTGETFVQRMKIRGISDALGDDGYIIDEVVGDDVDVDDLSGSGEIEGDARRVSGYVRGVSPDRALGQYVRSQAAA